MLLVQMSDRKIKDNVKIKKIIKYCYGPKGQWRHRSFSFLVVAWLVNPLGSVAGGLVPKTSSDTVHPCHPRSDCCARGLCKFSPGPPLCWELPLSSGTHCQSHTLAQLFLQLCCSPGHVWCSSPDSPASLLQGCSSIGPNPSHWGSCANAGWWQPFPPCCPQPHLAVPLPSSWVHSEKWQTLG